MKPKKPGSLFMTRIEWLGMVFLIFVVESLVAMDIHLLSVGLQ